MFLFFSNYHTERITSVDVDQNEPNTFVSSSVDRKVCLWDDRTPELASGNLLLGINMILTCSFLVLYINEFSAVKQVACHPSHSNFVIAGSSAGDIYLLDKREPKHFVTVYNCFNKPIHGLKFDKSCKLAVCGDNSEVIVLNCSENDFKPLYISHEHTDFVRGLTWWRDELYSCGYDGKCLKHCF